MMTPHINAQANDFAPTCLLPGDPLRAEYIAKTFLDSPKLVSSVRNMLAFTGSYQGTPVSVMGSGMGIPSISIYAKELITEYGVNNLIRVGSCGAVNRSVAIRDILIAVGACTDSKVNRQRFQDHDFSAIADYSLLKAANDAAGQLNLPVRNGNLFSADLFYTPNSGMFDTMESMGVLAVEMEAAGLYGVAAEFGAKALAICTVSDHIRTGEATTAEERQSSFEEMMKLALETSKSIEADTSK
ncbi:purine-nucleoside phosphorylase [Verrucomicrobiaceae bacterium N1E253]|uniref:Uridine phosphorylase n=1 Tax=Oceaniferula marina TaxID=2748318 RepID=A0A851GIB5_9BACT|nr:purine-nucleoside phosphorylase [Oceaniferula marina]